MQPETDKRFDRMLKNFMLTAAFCAISLCAANQGHGFEVERFTLSVPIKSDALKSQAEIPARVRQFKAENPARLQQLNAGISGRLEQLKADILSELKKHSVDPDRFIVENGHPELIGHPFIAYLYETHGKLRETAGLLAVSPEDVRDVLTANNLSGLPQLLRTNQLLHETDGEAILDAIMRHRGDLADALTAAGISQSRFRTWREFISREKISEYIRLSKKLPGEKQLSNEEKHPFNKAQLSLKELLPTVLLSPPEERPEFLNEYDQSLLIAFFLEGLALQDIAGSSGPREITRVKVALHRAFNRLANGLWIEGSREEIRKILEAVRKPLRHPPPYADWVRAYERWFKDPQKIPPGLSFDLSAKKEPLFFQNLFLQNPFTLRIGRFVPKRSKQSLILELYGKKSSKSKKEELLHRYRVGRVMPDGTAERLRPPDWRDGSGTAAVHHRPGPQLLALIFNYGPVDLNEALRLQKKSRVRDESNLAKIRLASKEFGGEYKINLPWDYMPETIRPTVSFEDINRGIARITWKNPVADRIVLTTTFVRLEDGRYAYYRNDERDNLFFPVKRILPAKNYSPLFYRSA